MLVSDLPLAIYMENAFGNQFGKMGYGILRFSPNPVVCIIDSTKAGKKAIEVMPDTPRPEVPIVSTIAEAIALGAKAMLLGSAPSGGRIPEDWYPDLDKAVAAGLSIINGLHQKLNDRYHNLQFGQWVWDIRQEPANIGVGKGRARELAAQRVLIVGTDMANGKMTTGLLMLEEARRRQVRANFLATGQIGITICGGGVPLDAIKLDYACGAIEQGVLALADADLIIVEGQGSLLHPGSTATLPLLRGSCPNAMILNHRADRDSLRDYSWMKIPPLTQVAALYESVASCCGLYPASRVTGIALNTAAMNEDEARATIERFERETGLPTTDCVRFGAKKLIDSLGY